MEGVLPRFKTFFRKLTESEWFLKGKLLSLQIRYEPKAYFEDFFFISDWSFPLIRTETKSFDDLYDFGFWKVSAEEEH